MLIKTKSFTVRLSPAELELIRAVAGLFETTNADVMISAAVAAGVEIIEHPERADTPAGRRVLAAALEFAVESRQRLRATRGLQMAAGACASVPAAVLADVEAGRVARDS